MRAYVIRQGDYLTKVAHEQGFDADTVWNDPKNADLKQQRNPSILCPGDVLYLPDSPPQPAPIAGGTENNYVAQIPDTHIRLSFRDAKGVMAGEPYVVDGLGDPVQGTTDGDGVAVITLTVNVRELQITFPGKNLVHAVLIGDMDPIDEAAGQRKRLLHLGHYELISPLGDDSDEQRDKDAILTFQTAVGLPTTGTMDDATKQALVEAHGC